MDEIQNLNKALYEKYLNIEEKALIDMLEDEFKDGELDYRLNELWNYDSFLGGIGAYSMPANPVLNPFAGGYVRYVFRPLQYARCNMELQNLYFSARDVIRDVGLYMEFVIKFLLKQHNKILSITSNKKTLGILTHKIYHMQIINDKQFEIMQIIISVYNKSKHGINNDKNRSMSFTPIDAIVFYLAVRKISTELLKPHYSKIYIDLGERLQLFHINYEFQRNFGFIEK